MEMYQGVILGIVQGLTEFLPVSSSGHLVLGQTFFGLKESQLIFDISVHVGTLMAVLVVYFKDILDILASVGRFITAVIQRQPVTEMIARDSHLRMAGMIVVGSIPTALLGLILKQFEHFLFTSTVLVGCMLILTGSLLWFSRRYYQTGAAQQKDTHTHGVKQAMVIGLVQGCAVIPGISRSGSTIAAGMVMGLDRAMAARFSFLLSIPAIIGAEVLGLKEMVETGGSLDSVTIVATLAAFVTGFIALKLLIQLVHAGRFHMFAPYCWVIGSVVLLSHIF